MSKPTRLLGIAEVARKTSWSRSSIEKLVAEKKFPPPVRMGPYRRAWLECEVDEWIMTKVNQRDQLIESSRPKIEYF